MSTFTPVAPSLTLLVRETGFTDAPRGLADAAAEDDGVLGGSLARWDAAPAEGALDAVPQAESSAASVAVATPNTADALRVGM